MIIIGLAGTFAAGKDIGAEYLAETYGLDTVSTGDLVRVIAQEKHGNIERATLQIVADDERAAHGAGVFVMRAVEQFKKDSDRDGLVITGVRSVGEAKEIKKQGGVLLFIDAPRKLRFERSIGRQRTGDEKTYEQFCQQEDRELKGQGDDETVINLNAVKKLADATIVNDKNLGTFFYQLEEQLKKLAQER